LLGFQMRNQYTFCTSNDDCTATGNYCEPKMGICKVKDNNMNCLQTSDCGANYFCSTQSNQTCILDKVKCSTDSNCKVNQFCMDGYCTNDYVMSKTLNTSLPYYDGDFYDGTWGFRSCDPDATTNPCFNASLVESRWVANMSNLISCQYDGSYMYSEPRCRALYDCAAKDGNQTCGDWQYCKIDTYYSEGRCVDFLGAACIHNDNCSNPFTVTKTNKTNSNYVCDWKSSNPTGICHYYGSICKQDTDCKAPNYKCNATISYAGELYGWCYSDVQPDNYCTDSKYLGVDQGALIFICCVIAISVARDLREAIISEMKLHKLYRKNKQVMEITPRRLFCLDPMSGTQTRSQMWVTFISLFFLESVLFIRKYMFIPLVLAVTCSVIVDQPANQIILNGVAIFFVVDIDNLLYDFFHDKGEKEKMEEEGELEMSPRESRYLKLVSLLSAAMLTTALILVLTAKKQILSSFKKCSDPNALFRYGGLFVIILLFVGYFLAEILVPILELIWPTDKKKSTKSIRQSWHEFSWQQLATSEGKLTVISQLIAILYILAQGAAGGGIFWGIINGYYYFYIGRNEKNYSNEDAYTDQATAIYSSIRTGIEDSLNYAYYY
jgi:hypothetical protein